MKQQEAPPPVLSPPNASPRVGGARRWPWSRKRRQQSLQVVPGSPQPAPPDAWHLLRYLDELEEWSHRVWIAAGVLRHWMPEVVRGELRDQWWTAARVPDAATLRDRIAVFWVRVAPWLAWNPHVEALPDPPADPYLLRVMIETLQREIERAGSPTVGSERSAAFRRAVRHLQLLRAAAAEGHTVGRRRAPAPPAVSSARTGSSG